MNGIMGLVKKANGTFLGKIWNLVFLRLKTIFTSQILMGHYSHSLSIDATIMVSNNCPIIGEHVVIIFVIQ